MIHTVSYLFWVSEVLHYLLCRNTQTTFFKSTHNYGIQEPGYHFFNLNHFILLLFSGEPFNIYKSLRTNENGYLLKTRNTIVEEGPSIQYTT